MDPKNKGGRPSTWTPEDIERLKRGFDMGLSYASLAVSLDRTVDKIRDGLKYHYPERTKYTLADRVARVGMKRQKVRL